MRLLFVLTVFIGTIGINAQSAPITITALADTVGVYDKYELVIAHTIAFTNPYDPQDIRLDAEFTAPTGDKFTVAGFYYRDFAQAPTNPDVLVAQDDSWRVRFTPTQAGDWSYTVSITTSAGTITSDRGTFTVTPSDKKGFVRVDDRNPRYFSFDNGTPYFPVGQNVGWAVDNPISSYQTWMDEMHAENANFMRVWMASWGFGIEWVDTGLGNYDNRQDRAFQFDRVLEMASERDMYIMLTLLNHGAFSETTNAEWENNPYNRANGGMLDSPIGFGTDPEARRFWLMRLRYIVARWGYSPNIMAWEWWNEINWTPLVDETILAPWMADSTAFLQSLDPYAHLITHSGSPMHHETIWGAETMSFTQQHLYDMRTLTRVFNQEISAWQEKYPDKPFLMGEFGSPDETLDLNGLLVHLGLWSAPMNGAAGTGMTWWWDNYIHPNDLYYHFGGVASFFADEDLGARTWALTSATLNEEDDIDAKVFGLQADNYALLWVVSDDYSDAYLERQYRQNLRNQAQNPLDIAFPIVTGAKITLINLMEGDYTVEWWDTFTGEIIQTERVTIGADGITLPVPDFDRDLALKIVPMP
ncbi:MAG: DUF5060 domain-containing protein [bacterium]|nr:DUF5060 domain-containing protein [bacterium]